MTPSPSLRTGRRESDVSLVFWSPYSYYYGLCAPYIYRHRCYNRPPSYVYIEVPIYAGDTCRGYDSDLNVTSTSEYGFVSVSPSTAQTGAITSIPTVDSH